MKAELEFKKVVLEDLQTSSTNDLLCKVCEQYFKHYYRQSKQLNNAFKELVLKYNSNTILKFLGPDGHPDDYVHVSLGHGIDHKNLVLMLDNGGEIYPVDEEIGQLCEDQDYCSDKNCCKKSIFWSPTINEVSHEKLIRYHSLIFYGWLSINWMKIEGHLAKIVVKTCENNSLTSFYLNDFQFHHHSKFDGVFEWQKAIQKFNKSFIRIEELYKYLKENTIDKA